MDYICHEVSVRPPKRNCPYSQSLRYFGRYIYIFMSVQRQGGFGKTVLPSGHIGARENESEKSQTGRTSKNRKKILNPSGEYARAKLLNNIVQKIRENRRVNGNKFEISNQSFQERTIQLKQVRRTANLTSQDYSNFLDNISNLNDEHHQQETDHDPNLERVTRLRNFGQLGQGNCELLSDHDRLQRNQDRVQSNQGRLQRQNSGGSIYTGSYSHRPRSNSQYRVTFTYSSPKHADGGQDRCAGCRRKCGCPRLKQRRF